MAMRVVVVGAGAFGGWTALALLRRGRRVTLLDAWGPGNSRASSGGRDAGHPRHVRCRPPLHRVGGPLLRALGGRRGPLGRPALPADRRPLDVRGRRLLRPRLAAAPRRRRPARLGARPRRRRPALPADRLRRASRPSSSSTRRATCGPDAPAGWWPRRSAAEGGEVRRAAVRPGPIRGGAMEPARPCRTAARLEADAYVFACGPWLGRLFPEVVGERVRPTRQEVFFFGDAGGRPPLREETLPVWIDFAGADGRIFYGIPGNDAARLQGGRRHPRRAHRPHDGRAHAEPGRPRRGPRRPRPPLPRPRRRPARRVSGLPVREQPRTATSSSTATRRPRTSGSWAAARATGSSSAPPSASTRPTWCSTAPARSPSSRSPACPASPRNRRGASSPPARRGLAGVLTTAPPGETCRARRKLALRPRFRPLPPAAVGPRASRRLGAQRLHRWRRPRRAASGEGRRVFLARAVGSEPNRRRVVLDLDNLAASQAADAGGDHAGDPPQGRLARPVAVH